MDLRTSPIAFGSVRRDRAVHYVVEITPVSDAVGMWSRVS